MNARSSRPGAAVSAVAAAVFKRLSGVLQWRALWLRHDKFIIGVSGVVFDHDGRVLLLRHRFWSGNPWGLPSGYARKGETWEEALAREVREETALDVEDVRLVGVRSGFRLRAEVYLTAELTDASPAPRVDGREVLEARAVPVDELPEGLRRLHVEMVHLAVDRRGRRG